jgi:hypothetical protein
MADALVAGKALQEMRSGSIESIIDAATALAEAYLGKPVDVLATHHDCMYVVVEGEECIRRLGIKTDQKGPHIVSNRVRDGLVTEATKDKYVASLLREAATALALGKECNQLRSIALLARKGGRYLFAEERDAVLATKDAPQYWEELYEANRKDIRKAAYGGLREEEARVPKSRYGMLAVDRVAAFDGDIKESLASIFVLVHEVAQDISSIKDSAVVAHGWDAKRALETMRIECKAILGSGAKALELSESMHLADLAVMHDRLADVTKALLVMRRFLTTSTSTN